MGIDDYKGHSTESLQSLVLTGDRGAAMRELWRRRDAERAGRDTAQALKSLAEEAYVDPHGIYRWRSNERVPPADLLDHAERGGFTFNRAAHDAARDQETTAFLDEYRARMADHVPSAEELFEMRANFGTNTTVVNVVTGKAIKL